MIPLQQRFVNFRWGKDTYRWLFLIPLSVQPGSARVVAANVEEASVAMALGDAERYLIGTPVVMTMPPAAGKPTTRWLFPLVALTHFQTAKFSALHAT